MEPDVVQALEPYVPGWVRRRLAIDPSLPEGPLVERFEGCVLLADISGFTSLAERARRHDAQGAEEVQEVLNFCFGKLGELIERHGGEVLAFPGDAALGLWRPERESDLRQAVAWAARCGIAIRNEVDGTKTPGGFRIRLRIVVTCGPTFCALLGGTDARWAAVVGGLPLEGLAGTLRRARPGELVFSDEAAALLNPPVRSRREPSPYFSKAEFIDQGTRDLPRLGPSAEAALRAFVPATVQARIDAGQIEWLAEFRHVTAMFVGVGGLGDMAGNINLLHEITRAMQAAVQGHGGQVNQLLVDEKGMTLLAAWGVAHHSFEDNAARAVAASLAISGALGRLDVPGAIGLASGRVWTGRRGYVHRSEFAMIGDVVNLGARLMQASERTALCEEVTMREASSVYEFEQMGTIPLKGRQEPASLFRPVEEKRPPHQRGFPELIGRVAEQKLLLEAVEQVAHRGRGGAYLISGDPGVGKSHLISKVLERAEGMSVVSDCVWGNAVPSSGAYAEVRELLRRHAGLDGFAEAEQLERVRSLLGLSENEPKLALLGKALGFEIPQNEVTSAMSAQARAEATRELLVTLYAKATGGGPLLLVLEDAHWLESQVWAWVAALRGRIDALLLLIASRPMGDALPEAARQVLEQPDVVSVELDGLDAAETQALVCQCLGVDSIPALVARMVHDRSEGHPLFTQELAYSLRDRGLVELRRRECMLVVEDLQSLELPKTVEDVVTSRIDLLSAPEQLTLKVAGVLGRRFDLADLAAIHPLHNAPAHLAAQLEAMTRLDLVVREGDGGKFAFKHVITRQVAYGLLAFAQRRRLHLAAAQRFEAEGNAAHPDYALLAHHWQHADRPERALDYLGKAGDQARQDFANDEAAGFFEKALALEAEARVAQGARFRLGPLSAEDVRRAGWLRKLGEARSSLGQIERAVSSLVRALETLGRRSPRTDRGWAVHVALEICRRLARRVVPSALHPRARRSEEATLEEVRALSILGADYYVLDRILPFVGALLSAAGAADAIGPTRDRALAYADLANVAGVVPLHRVARRYGRIALATAEAVNEPRTRARVLGRTAIYLGSVGTWRVKELDEALAIADRLGDDHIWEETGAVLCGHLYFLGDLQRCYALGSEVAERAARSGSLLHELWGLTTQAQCLLHFGRYEEAIQCCRQTIVHLGTDGGPDRDSEIKAHGILAGAQHRLGRVALAFAAADRAAQLVERFGRVGYQFFPGAAAVADVYISAWEADLLAPGGHPAVRAERLCGQLERFSRRYRVAGPRTQVFRSRIHWLRGHRGRAKHAIHRGLAEAEALGMGFDAALARFERACLLESGATRTAELSAAARVFEATGAMDELYRVERALREPVGARR